MKNDGQPNGAVESEFGNVGGEDLSGRRGVRLIRSAGRHGNAEGQIGLGHGGQGAVRGQAVFKGFELEAQRGAPPAGSRCASCSNPRGRPHSLLLLRVTFARGRHTFFRAATQARPGRYSRLRLSAMKNEEMTRAPAPARVKARNKAKRRG